MDAGERRSTAEPLRKWYTSAGVTIGDEDHLAGPGTTMYIPGYEWHAIRPVGDQPVRLFYCFPTDSFADVMYEYPDDPTP